jgi:hypothetical protein
MNAWHNFQSFIKSRQIRRWRAGCRRPRRAGAFVGADWSVGGGEGGRDRNALCDGQGLCSIMFLDRSVKQIDGPFFETLR